MPIRWNNLIPSHLMGNNHLGGTDCEDFIEHAVGAQSLQALASDLLAMTPRQERDLSQTYPPTKYDSATPPLSPSTTISSLPTEEHYASDESAVTREQVKRGKQPVVLVVSFGGCVDGAGVDRVTGRARRRPRWRLVWDGIRSGAEPVRLS